MSDLTCYADIIDAYTEGVDYEVTARPGMSGYSVIAIHAGKIEPHSGTVARAIAGDAHTLYEFAGLRADSNTTLHLTATEFNEPRCVDLQAHAQRTVSVHGYPGTEQITYLGGRDTELADSIAHRLTKAGFKVAPAPPEIAGTSPDNIANRNLSGKGVQLELTRALRDHLAVNYETLRKYAAAVTRTF